jgi:hypothetical protein
MERFAEWTVNSVLFDYYNAEKARGLVFRGFGKVV